VIEFNAGFLRQAAARLLGNDRPDQLQDFLACQWMARRILGGASRIQDLRGSTDGEAQAAGRRVGQQFQHPFNSTHDCCTSVSATMCAELTNKV
jgi:hypothetical protein